MRETNENFEERKKHGMFTIEDITSGRVEPKVVSYKEASKQQREEWKEHRPYFDRIKELPEKDQEDILKNADNLRKISNNSSEKMGEQEYKDFIASCVWFRIEQLPRWRRKSKAKVSRIDRVKGESSEESVETTGSQENTSFFEEEKTIKKSNEPELKEQKTIESPEEGLKKNLKESLYKFHSEITKREDQTRNLKLEDKDLESLKAKFAKQLTKESYSPSLLNWFKKPGQSQDHEVILELINEIWGKGEPKEEFTTRLGREKRAWLQRRLKEMMEAEKEMPLAA